MAIQTVRFGAQGTPTAVKTFEIGSDTVVGSGSSITPATNAAAIWTCQFTDHTPGVYQIIATDSDGDCLAQWYVRIKSETGVYNAYEIPDAGVVTEERAEILDQVIIAEGPHRTVTITSSNQIASRLYSTQPNSITESTFATGAISDRVIAADFKDAITTIVDTITADLALQETLLQIKERTDNIPDDPADQSEIIVAINTIISAKDRIILGPCERNVVPGPWANTITQGRVLR